MGGRGNDTLIRPIKRSKLSAVRLLAAVVCLTGFAATGDDDTAGLDSDPAGHMVPMFPSAADVVRQGFVRVINHSARSGEILMEPIDDAGTRFGPVALAIDAGETVHFNSGDLERGNAEKGLPEGVGPGNGDWRIELSSDLDIEVLSYVRTRDGFLTSMHDTAPLAEDGRGRVAMFNPGSNMAQESRLRLINPSAETVEVTVVGMDDRGNAGGEVVVSVPAGVSRTLTALELESGGGGIEGALGDGDGKWRLRVEADPPVVAMSLLLSPTGHLTNLSTAPANVDGAGARVVPLFPAASDALGRQGFVRVVNRSAEAGEVSIDAHDDTDRDYEPVTLSLAANAVAHFNSDDLELGNADKGLSGRTGAGDGDWRLTLASDLDIDVLAYIRTTGDGFLTAMHDAVPSEGSRHRVATFNPGSNVDQASRLRLVNAGNETAQVTVAGIDGLGEGSPGSVSVAVPAGASRTLTAQELETGGDGFAGQLGDGAGKWQLVVESEQPITVMSLLSSPGGHLTNLSTAPALDFAPTEPTVFNDRVVGKRLVGGDAASYVDFLAGGRFRATRRGETFEGDYSYTHTGPHRGMVVLDFDDGDRCTYDLVFRSRAAGSMGFSCDGGDGGESNWSLVETSDSAPPDRAVTSFDLFDLDINTSPTGIGHVNGRFHVVNAASYARKVFAYGEDGVRDAAADFDLHGDNGNVEGIAHANGRFHVLDWGDDKVYAYTETGERDVAADFDLHGDNGSPGGIVHADGRFHVIDSLDDKVYAYTEAGERDAAADFDLDDDNDSVRDVAHADGRFHVLDGGGYWSGDEKVYAYTENGERDAAADWDLLDGEDVSPGGITHANGRIHVLSGGHSRSGDERVYAYTENGERDAAADFDLHGDNGFPGGIAHADGRIHVVDFRDDKVYAYAETGERDAAADFDLDDDIHYVGGIAHADGRFHVVDGGTANTGDAKVYVYGTDGTREAEADFDLDDDNGDPEGIAHANGRFHVVDSSDEKVFAYTAAGERDAAADFDLDDDNRYPEGIAHANGRLYVGDRETRKVYIYPLP